jgi:hypothetical protein
MGTYTYCRKKRKLPLRIRLMDRAEILHIIGKYMGDKHIKKSAHSDAWILCNEEGKFGY